MEGDEREIAYSEWSKEICDNITLEMLEVMKKQNKREFGNLLDPDKRVIYNKAIFNLLILINYPQSFMMSINDREKFCLKYKAFTNSMENRFSELCDEFYHWEP